MNICYYYCKVININDKIFNEKISLEKLKEILNELKLLKIGKIKEYWINNVQIISLNNQLSFNYINDISIDYKDNFLIQKFNKIECKPFNFCNIDLDDEFILYENKEKTIELREFNSYLTLQFYFDINDNNFLYNNILNIL
tara:strand:- start:112 stop:534 length:423 start_codon:yes stop_codon:yes gene_type:complete